MSPRIIKDFRGYSFFIWSNEPDEPMHVHVSKTGKRGVSDKFWSTPEGWRLDEDAHVVSPKDMPYVLEFLEVNSAEIISNILAVHPNMRAKGAIGIKRLKLN